MGVADNKMKRVCLQKRAICLRTLADFLVLLESLTVSDFANTFCTSSTINNRLSNIWRIFLMPFSFRSTNAAESVS